MSDEHDHAEGAPILGECPTTSDVTLSLPRACAGFPDRGPITFSLKDLEGSIGDPTRVELRESGSVSGDPFASRGFIQVTQPRLARPHTVNVSFGGEPLFGADCYWAYGPEHPCPGKHMPHERGRMNFSYTVGRGGEATLFTCPLCGRHESSDYYAKVTQPMEQAVCTHRWVYQTLTRHADGTATVYARCQKCQLLEGRRATAAQVAQMGLS